MYGVLLPYFAWSFHASAKLKKYLIITMFDKELRVLLEVVP